jgi:signal transduction histidine kinase/phage shock protein PspC (stress-responsive transcriptional regulator)
MQDRKRGTRLMDHPEPPATRARRWQRAWRGTCTGEALRRDPDDRLAGGVAAGVARWRGYNPTTVRIAFVIGALISSGTLVPFYFAGWLLIPSRVTDAAGAHGAEYSSVWSTARHDSRGIALAVAIASMLSVVMVMAGVLNAGFIQAWGWPQVISAACLVLIWRNAPARDQEVLRRVVARLEFGQDGTRRGGRLRVVLACVLLIAGVVSLASARATISLLRPLAGLVLVLAALVLLLGPWWLRIARDLVLERQARARAEERTELAARVHDSVLQTLALIQRRADDPAAVTQLARAQERELRSWLFEGRAPGTVTGAESVAAGVRQIQKDAEARHGVPVEVVTVGDCPLDDDLAAMLEAAREAVVNAAKWSGAPVISVFAEVTPEGVEIVVRDRGKGFEPLAVPADRKGLSESVHGRMARHGGTVTVQAAVGEGAKVSLKMPRAAGARSAARE